MSTRSPDRTPARVAWRLAALLVPLVLVLPARGQDPAEPDPVEVRFSVHPATAAPGDVVEVRAELTVEPGWHIYAAEPGGKVIPTGFTITPPPGLEPVGGLVEPASEVHAVPYVGDVRVHRGKLVLARRLRVGSDVRGSLQVPAAVRFQPCEDREAGVCLFETTEQGVVTLSVEPPAAGGGPGGGPGGDDPFGGGLFGGQEPAAAAGPEVEVVVTLEPARPAPGGEVRVQARLRVAEGWHVYGVETPFGIPTALELELPPALVRAGALREEPAAHEEQDPIVGPMRVQRGAVLLEVPLKVAPDATGTLHLRGKVTWQACSEGEGGVCKDGEHPFSLAVTLPGQGEQRPVAPPSPGPGPAGEQPPELSLGRLTLASFLLGLAMLLMPCTYPMIPITVSIFSKGKQLSRPRSVFRAAVYALGIVLSFVLVAALVQVAFGAAGQGAVTRLATNPWLNLVIGVLFVYFAFSFFGYYEVGLPAPLMRFMQLGAARRDETGTVPTWSLFLMGLFFVLTSYTCGAPIVLGVFGTALSDPHPMAVVYATLVFSLTVAVPFFALSLVPGALRAMPRSGAWFSVFKVVMGFVELGFAVKFLRGADLMWEWDLLSRTLILAAWTGLALAVAVYLLGLLPFRFPHDPKLRPPSGPRVVFAALFLALAGYFGLGAAGRPLQSAVEAFILATAEVRGDEVVFGPAPADGTEDRRLAYRTDLEALNEAERRDRKAFLLFTGHNCINCQQMENGVLVEPDVMARLKDVTRVALFTDKGTPEEDRHRALLLERFRTASIPAFYVIGPDGQVLASQIGGTDKASFIRFLEQGGL